MGNRFTDGRNGAGKLVSGNRGRAADPGSGAIIVEVGSADARNRDRERNLVGCGSGGGRDRFMSQVADPVEAYRFHQMSFRYSWRRSLTALACDEKPSYSASVLAAFAISG